MYSLTIILLFSLSILVLLLIFSLRWLVGYLGGLKKEREWLVKELDLLRSLCSDAKLFSKSREKIVLLIDTICERFKD